MDELQLGKSAKGSWVQRTSGDFAFLTGLAYVDMVRLDDGTIWKSDEDAILTEIRKIETDFDAKLLKDKSGAEK